MLGRLSGVFDRYAERTLRLECPIAPQNMQQNMQQDPPPDPGADPGAGLTITRHAIIAGRIVIEGHAPQGPVLLRRGTAEQHGQSRPGLSGAARFVLSLPMGPAQPGGPAPLEIIAAGQIRVLPPVPPLRLRLARLALVPRFAATVAGALPLIWRWLARRDALARRLVRDRLGLGPLTVAQDLDARALAPQTDPVTARTGPQTAILPGPVRIVMPVYNGIDLLPEVIDRVIRHTDVPARLLLIDDASPDPGIAPLLAGFARAHPWIEVQTNAGNLGFVGTANRGLAWAAGADPAAPVILLNSDALVPAGWASRLLAPLASAATASVTPFSNDAELLSVPAICARSDLPPGAADALDRLAATLAAGPVALPTGVGFCMAMAPQFLAQVPGFDPAFGRGYGEEVDWCQRTAALGGQHLGLPGLFVEHRGGASFGSAAKARLLAENGARISARWPDFDAAVRAVLAADPLITPRLALGLGLAGIRAGIRAGIEAGIGAEIGSATDPVPIYLAHTMGGGAEDDLIRRTAADVARIGAAVVLRVGAERRWQIELITAAGTTMGRTDDTGLMLRLLRLLPRRQIVYSCAVGDADPAALPALLLDLAGDVPPAVLIHDYFLLSPSFTLQDADGRYRGLPMPAADGADNPAHRMQRGDGTRIGLAAWRAAWAPLIDRAHRIETFSPAAAALVAAAYPAAAGRIAICPHAPLWQPGQPGPARQPGPPVIGILGNIGQAKGAALLAPLAAAIARRGWPHLVIPGQIDPAYALPRRSAHVGGGYERADIPALIARHGITHWLIPSVWPETFSFTTQEALATGLPVWCFDLGGQADQVRAALAANNPGGLIGLRDGDPDPALWPDGFLDRIGHDTGSATDNGSRPA